MASTVLHIKTEVECKVFLFDEEKGIASSEEQFNLEVNNGYQDLLFVSTTENNTCHYSTILIEKEGTEYHIDLCKGDFQQLTIEIIQLMKNVCRGDVEAQAKLGACFIEGRGLINKNLNTGLLLLKRAVAVNNPYAQNAVGFCFQNGLGVPQDYYKAVFWYRKAAEQNNTAAQYHLASCYEWGLGVDKNNGEAYRWMKKAALQGKCRAQIALGSYYEKGIGTAIDLEESLYWYKKAALKGDTYAINGLKRVKFQLYALENNLKKLTDKYPDYREEIYGIVYYPGCYKDKYDVIYDETGECLLNCTNFDIKDYQIIDGCVKIDDCAFFKRNYPFYSLNKITLPDSVTHIGKEAFFCCTKLKQVVFPKKLLHIGDGAFDLCSSLSEINLPPSVCYIGGRAFYSCSSITSVNIPSSITIIKEGTFGACTKLKDVLIPQGVKTIEKDAFFLCKSLEKIVLPEGLESIGDHAFSQCDNLFSISLPNTIQHINKDAFKWCDNLREIHIPRGTYSAFRAIFPEHMWNIFIEDYNPNNSDFNIPSLNYLFFDTETTGIPRDYNAPASNTSNWPRLVQLGWILTDESGNEISSGNEIIKPEGFSIPSDASRVHGITTEVALRDGKPLKQVIESFLKDTKGIRCFVGHNVSFDQRVVGAELYRLGIEDTISTARSLDTMIAATDFCKIPGSYGYKWPKLIELHRKLFGCDFEDAHDAMADITAIKKCFFEMKRRGLI